MNRRLTKTVLLSVLTMGLGLGITGCDKPQASAPQPSAAVDPLPTSLFLAEAPAGAKDLAAVRKEAKDGDEVVVRARIGGRHDPFTDGRAVVMVMDPAIKSCAEEEGDSCPTPWDYCCEPPESLLANSATVQILGPDGKPLKANLKNTNGLKPLSEVVVKGKLQNSPDGKSAIINATALYVKS